MVMGVLASGNAFVGHSTNKPNLHKKAAFKLYSCATCPRADRPAKLRQQINSARRIRRPRPAGCASVNPPPFEKSHFGFVVPPLGGAAWYPPKGGTPNPGL